MAIRTIREPDTYLSAVEQERLRREWEVAQQYTTMPQSFETWLRGRLAAQLAEAQRDAERLDWIIEHRAYVVSDPDSCDGYWLNYARLDGTVWTQATEHETPRAAIDAAKESA